MTVTANNSKQWRRNWAWIWFAYTGFLFIDPILDPSLYLWLGTIAAFAVFVGIFVAFVRSSDECHPARFWMIAATFALGLLCFPWNQGASTFFVYAAAFLPFSIVSIRRVFSLFVLEALLILGEGYVFHARPGILHISWPSTFVAIFLTGIIGGGNVLFAQQRARRPASSAKRTGREPRAGRGRRARTHRARPPRRPRPHPLRHRAQGRTRRAASSTAAHASDPQRAAAEIADVERIARTALAEVREAIGGYRSPAASPPRSKPRASPSMPPASP
jgi:two-component system sensor histidine kinase DesK